MLAWFWGRPRRCGPSRMIECCPPLLKPLGDMCAHSHGPMRMHILPPEGMQQAFAMMGVRGMPRAPQML